MADDKDVDNARYAHYLWHQMLQKLLGFLGEPGNMNMKEYEVARVASSQDLVCPCPAELFLVVPEVAKLPLC